MYRQLRSFLFKLDPEVAHNLTVGLLGWAGSLSPIRQLLSHAFAPSRSQAVDILGLRFPNPVGLAAGFDKDCVAWRGLAALGFGHIEVGTITLKPQPGNPKPRVFRLPEDQALINRMGFPGKGTQFAVRRLSRIASSRVPNGVILGINLGKNSQTPNAEAAGDYLELIRLFAGQADYFAVNVSSPNTVGLRDLQARDPLEALLKQLIRERDGLKAIWRKPLPLLVKLAPDLTDSQLDEALEAITAAGADGIIASNTTLQRNHLANLEARQSGGLSGLPLKSLSTTMIRKISRRTGGKLPIIGVGGISSPADGREKMDAGASLIQIYTGLVYQGPGLVKELVENLP